MTQDPAGAAAFRTWRRRLQHRRPAGSTAYAAYVVVLFGGVYGSMAWSYLTSLGLGGPGSAWPPERFAVLGAGLLGVAAVVAARAGAPLWVSRREAAYALSGQFRPRVVLRRRGALLLVAVTALGAFAGGAAASGGSQAGTAMWTVGAGAAATAPVALGVVAQVARWRVVADVIVGAVVVLGLVLVAVPRTVTAACAAGSAGCAVSWTQAGPGLVGVLAAATVAAVSWWGVLGLVPGRLDVDDVATRGTRTAGVGLGMAAGDTRAASRAVPVRYRGSRQVLTAPRAERAPGARGNLVGALMVRMPVLARDLLGQRRRPWVTLGGAAAALGGAWLTLTAHSRPLLALGAVALYVAVGGLGLGMAAFFAQSVPGGLLPARRGRLVLARHASVPGLGVGAALALVCVAVRLFDVPEPRVLTAAGVAALALAVRTWVASGSTVPVALYTPVITPLGDLSVLHVAAWFARGWLVVATVGWLAGTARDAQGWVAPVLGTVLFGTLAAIKADR